MKKFTALFFAVIFVLTAFVGCGKKETETTTAPESTREVITYSQVNQEGHVEGVYEYSFLDDDTIMITGYNSDDVTTEYLNDLLVIPSEINGKTVTVIGKAAFKNADIPYQVTFPSSLVEIQDEAFMGSTIKVADILSSKMKKIGVNAFADCTQLLKVDIKSSIESIGKGAFATPSIKYFTARGNFTCFDKSQFDLSANIKFIIYKGSDGADDTIAFAKSCGFETDVR